MKPREEGLLATRATLLERLKNLEDQASWQVFFDTYWRLIYGVARQSGLNESEAQDVVQETMLATVRHLPTFKYNPALGSFKAWLLNMTRWRVTDQLRKRNSPIAPNPAPIPADGGSAITDPVALLADPATNEFERLWASEWQSNLLEVALRNVKHRIDPFQYQIFDLYVTKGWAPEKVAAALGVSTNQVYLAKHRIAQLVKEEVERLEQETI